MNRRRFLYQAGGTVAAILAPTSSILPAFDPLSDPLSPIAAMPDGRASKCPQRARHRKLILVVFGGGTRHSESIGDPHHRYIPRLWNDLVPSGALFTDVRVEGRVVHTNCSASILTGHREYDVDNDWSRPVEHPTVFEILRRDRAASDTAAWAFVYASILANTGESCAAGFGHTYAANVVEPPTIPRETAERIGAQLRQASATGSIDQELNAALEGARWARAESRINLGGLRSAAARRFTNRQYSIWQAGSGTTSHDAFLANLAISCMNHFAPDIITLAFGEIDCAHYGSWSRYVEAIQRTDALTFRIWQAAQRLESYRDRTLLMVLPDHGRELERPGGLGYVHHSNFYTRQGEDEGCRHVWLLLLGPGIAQGRTITKQVPQTAAAATALEYLGLEASAGAARSVLALAST